MRCGGTALNSVWFQPKKGVTRRTARLAVTEACITRPGEEGDPSTSRWGVPETERAASLSKINTNSAVGKVWILCW